jgi:hypothetical protein
MLKRIPLLFALFIICFIQVLAQKQLTYFDTYLPNDFVNINNTKNGEREIMLTNKVSEVWFNDGSFAGDTTHRKYNKEGLLIEDNEWVVKFAYGHRFLGLIDNDSLLSPGHNSYRKTYEYTANKLINKITFWQDMNEIYHYDIMYNDKSKIEKVGIVLKAKDKVDVEFQYDKNGLLQDMIGTRGKNTLYTVRFYNVYDDEKKRALLRREYVNGQLLVEYSYIDTTISRLKWFDYDTIRKAWDEYPMNWSITTFHINKHLRLEINQTSYEIDDPEVWATYLSPTGDDIKSDYIKLSTDGCNVKYTSDSSITIEGQKRKNPECGYTAVDGERELDFYLSNGLLSTREFIRPTQDIYRVDYHYKYW